MKRLAGRPRELAYQKVEKINHVGLKRLRRFIEEHHPNGVEYFERNCAMIRDYCLYGGEYISKKYGCSEKNGFTVLGRYYEYALAAEKEDADGCDESTLR